MDKESPVSTQEPATDPAKSEQPPRSLAVASGGIKTGKDFAKLMSALMSDLIEGRVTPNVGNATCNAGGKLLKVVEMEYKYGTAGKGGNKKTLLLAIDEGEEAST